MVPRVRRRRDVENNRVSVREVDVPEECARGGESMIPVVYIAGKYTAPTKLTRRHNTFKANDLGDLVTSAGCFPLIPHQVGLYREELQPETWWIDATMAALQKCDAAIFLPGWEFSPESRKERKGRITKNRPVFDAETVEGELILTDDFLAWVAKFSGNTVTE
jgi:hypothetical protein